MSYNNSDDKLITIAIDAMGGDNAPSSVIQGIGIFLKKHKNKYPINFLLYGDEKIIKNQLSKEKNASAYCKIIHTDKVVSSDDKIYEVLRNGKGSSMWEAISAVSSLEAKAVISAGNTGALMAISKLKMKMLSGIDRPAIVNSLPGKKEPVVMLDLGANSDCTPEVLSQFAIMGDIYSKIVNEVANPRVALLNIGSESIKGNVNIQETTKLLSKISNKINYIGFIEGDEIFNGKADVVVTDGFTGNIALKCMEGTSKYIGWTFKNIIIKSLFSKIGIVFMIRGILKAYKKIDPRKFNGAMLIGVNGISVKAHGSSDKVAFSYALLAVSKLATGNVNRKIEEELLG